MQGHACRSGLSRSRDCACPSSSTCRTDPYEFADITSNTYYDWFIRRDYIVFAINMVATKFAETFNDFPPIQKPNSFTIDDAITKMRETAAGGG